MTWNQLKRLVNPNTNPALIPWLFSAALAAWQGFETAPGPLSWAKVGRVLGPVVIGLAVGYQRSKTTPVADPKDGNGQPLAALTMRQVHDAAAAFGWTLTKETPTARMTVSTIAPNPTTTTTGGAS